MNTDASTFDTIVNARRSIRKFDKAEAVPDEVIRRSLERAILSPNSSNMQLWEFLWVRSAEVRSGMVPICMGQNAAKSASHLVVFLTRRGKWKRIADWNLRNALEDLDPSKDEKRIRLAKRYYGTLMPLFYRSDPFGLSWLARVVASFFGGLKKPFLRFGGVADQRVVLHKSCALAAQTFMLSVTAEGYDSCPMEGFDRIRLRRFLKLPNDAEVCMIVAVGKGTPEGIYGQRRRLPFEDVVKVL